MDKKMRQVSKHLRHAQKIINDAVSQNMKLADFDERVRDPQIKKLKKLEKKKRHG
jgi:hypothetical protein